MNWQSTTHLQDAGRSDRRCTLHLAMIFAKCAGSSGPGPSFWPTPSAPRPDTGCPAPMWRPVDGESPGWVTYWLWCLLRDTAESVHEACLVCKVQRNGRRNLITNFSSFRVDTSVESQSAHAYLHTSTWPSVVPNPLASGLSRSQTCLPTS